MNALGKPHGSIGRSEWHGITSPAYWVLETTDIVDSHFVHHLLRSHWAVQRYAGLGKNLPPNQFDIPWETFAAMEVGLPSLMDQRRIADFLDDRVARIDQIIAARQAQRSLVGQMRMAAADSVLTDHDWSSATRFGYFITKIEQGWSPQCESVSATADEWGVLKVSAVWAGHFRPAENKLLPSDLEPQRIYEIRPGDLLVTRANTPQRVGAFAVVPPGTRERLILCDKIMRVEVRDVLSVDFASLVGQTRRTRDLLTGSGTGTSQSMVNIRGDDIREIPIPVLTMNQQRARVAAWRESVECFNDGEHHLSQEIQLLNEYKQSLITAAVTGEFDVTTAATKIPEF